MSIKQNGEQDLPPLANHILSLVYNVTVTIKTSLIINQFLYLSFLTNAGGTDESI